MNLAKKNLFLIVVFSLLSVQAKAFPTSIDNGSSKITNGTLTGALTVGNINGVTSNANSRKHKLGFYYSLRANFDGFLRGGFPLRVTQDPAPALGSRFTISANRTHEVGWTSGVNLIPVRYRVYFGESSSDLKLIDTVVARQTIFSSLNYLQDYFWQIESFDQFGRATKSGVFSFAIAPPIEKFHSAPNPFNPTVEPTTMVFSMSGLQTADLNIYSMPHLSLVYTKTLTNLTDGTNTFIYDGKDNEGRILFNGVYLAILKMSGLNESVTQRFKIMVVK